MRAFTYSNVHESFPCGYVVISACHPITQVRPMLQLQCREEHKNTFEAPLCFGTIYNTQTSTFGILMEDMRNRGARFPNAHEHELTVAEVKSVLRNLAVLHAQFWGSERLEAGGDLEWLPDPSSDSGIEHVFQSIGFGMIRDLVLSHAFAVEALHPLLESVRSGLGKGVSGNDDDDDHHHHHHHHHRDLSSVDTDFVEVLWGCLQTCNREVLSRPPLTLCHGDTHIQNVYVLPDGECGLFDFQLTLRASWARDVSYILATGMAEGNRRRWQEQLVAYYLDQVGE